MKDIHNNEHLEAWDNTANMYPSIEDLFNRLHTLENADKEAKYTQDPKMNKLMKTFSVDDEIEGIKDYILKALAYRVKGCKESKLGLESTISKLTESNKLIKQKQDVFDKAKSLLDKNIALLKDQGVEEKVMTNYRLIKDVMALDVWKTFISSNPNHPLVLLKKVMVDNLHLLILAFTYDYHENYLDMVSGKIKAMDDAAGYSMDYFRYHLLVGISDNKEQMKAHLQYLLPTTEDNGGEHKDVEHCEKEQDEEENYFINLLSTINLQGSQKCKDNLKAYIRVNNVFESLFEKIALLMPSCADIDPSPAHIYQTVTDMLIDFADISNLKGLKDLPVEEQLKALFLKGLCSAVRADTEIITRSFLESASPDDLMLMHQMGLKYCGTIRNASIDYHVPQKWPTYSNPQTAALDLVSYSYNTIPEYKDALRSIIVTQAEKQIKLESIIDLLEEGATLAQYGEALESIRTYKDITNPLTDSESIYIKYPRTDDPSEAAEDLVYLEKAELNHVERKLKLYDFFGKIAQQIIEPLAENCHTAITEKKYALGGLPVFSADQITAGRERSNSLIGSDI